MERVYKLHKRTYKAKNYDIIGILLAALVTVQKILFEKKCKCTGMAKYIYQNKSLPLLVGNTIKKIINAINHNK